MLDQSPTCSRRCPAEVGTLEEHVVETGPCHDGGPGPGALFSPSSLALGQVGVIQESIGQVGAGQIRSCERRAPKVGSPQLCATRRE